MNEPTHTNRLIESTSPYLLQHAHNPVDWHPWGEDALERARREDKPIFLSIGYSACHWCHVMERESFEDEETARIMNEHFICIKVDREERPDLDEIYVNVVQLMGGGGGWPTSVFLTPDLEPFYGGTYFPPQDMHGRPSFRRVLLSAAKAHREQRGKVSEVARELIAALRTPVEAATAAAPPEAGLIEDAVTGLKQLFDPEWGGFGGAPKFPQAGAISLLLRHHHRTGDEEALRMATLTLDRMACGGIYDQLGGGFHRYAVDRGWLVPHFEKMLYDNALLAEVYLDAFQVTGGRLYRRIASETLDYVLREMTDEAGGFHSAQDADTDGVEGAYYVWTLGEVNEILERDEAEICRRYYGLTESGNFEGRNILHVPLPPEECAEAWAMPVAELEQRLGRIRATLLARRAERTPPAKDDKVLADWNGLMISTLARAYQTLRVEAYRAAAVRAAEFILSQMTSDGRLLHAYRAGRAHIDGFLDDHAFLAQGLLDLYEATFDSWWIDRAETLARQMIARFWDGEAGGFYMTAADQPDVIARTRKAHDRSIPSGNSVAAHALLRLGRLTDQPQYVQRAEQTLGGFRSQTERSPTAFARLLCALDFHLGPVKEIAICGGAERPDTAELLAVVRQRYLPNKVVALVDPGSESAATAVVATPMLGVKPMLEGEATAYMCEDGECKPPVSAPAALERLLAD